MTGPAAAVYAAPPPFPGGAAPRPGPHPAPTPGRLNSAPKLVSGRFETAGHRLHWELWGETVRGDVVLLHHGLGSVRAWKDQIPDLVEAGWRVLVYDRWGYGLSDARPALDLPGFETDLRDLESLLGHLGVARPALIGHSDGGTLALYYAARHPEQVSALVTVAAHIYVEPSMIPGLQSVRLAFETDARLREGLRRAHGDRFEQVFRNWADGWSRPEHRAWDMRPGLQAITCPALVIQGEHDEHATPQHARELAAALPHSRLWLLPGAGHMAPQDHLDEFNWEVLSFLGTEHTP